MSLAAAAELVAVWAPEGDFLDTRMTISRAEHDAVAALLTTSGFSVQRLPTAELAALSEKSPFAAVVIASSAFPRLGLEPMRRYLANGGALVDLGGGRLPLFNLVKPDGKGSWSYDPAQPQFAWQNRSLVSDLGLSYRYSRALNDRGTSHTPTPFLQTLGRDLTAWQEPLASLWFERTPATPADARLFPLIASARVDGVATIPAAWLGCLGKRVVVAVPDARPVKLTGQTPGRQAPVLVVALVRAALAARAGRLPAADTELKLTADWPELTPLSERQPTGEADPDLGAKVLQRWGRFDGSQRELSTPEGGRQLPGRLDPGAQCELPLPPGADRLLRVRFAYANTGAGLAVSSDDMVLHQELFRATDVAGSFNFGGPEIEGVRPEAMRCIPLPNTATRVRISNPGTKPLWFDAAQVQGQPLANRRWLVGIQSSLRHDGHIGPDGTIRTRDHVPQELSRRWGTVRFDPRLDLVGPPDAANRWEKLDAIVERTIAYGAPLHWHLMGTPRWMVLRPSELAASKLPGRLAPDPVQWATMIGEIIDRYRDKANTAIWEVWNEPNIRQFWQGSPQDYIALWKAVAPVIRAKAPNATLQVAGLAGYSQEFVDALINAGVYAESDSAPVHTYSGEAPAWDIPFGQFEGALFARGISTEREMNECGFVWKDAWWFKSGWNPQRQADATEIALARLTSNGCIRLNLFHAGGDKDPFGYLDPQGQPYPGYHVFTDFLELHGLRRLDCGLQGLDGMPVLGAAAVAGLAENGSAKILISTLDVGQPRGLRVTVPWSASSIQLQQLQGSPTQTSVAQRTAGIVQVDIQAPSRVVLQLRP